MPTKQYWSNCVFEALRAKLRYGSQIKIIVISPKVNDGPFLFPHFMWYDRVDGNVYDFHTNKRLSTVGALFWKGYIRIQPLEVFNRWYRTVGREFVPPQSLRRTNL